MAAVDTKDIMDLINKKIVDIQNPAFDQSMDAIWEQIGILFPDKSWTGYEADALSNAIMLQSKATSLATIEIMIEIFIELGLLVMEKESK
ncbi:hypothetical protein ACOYX7_02820 [Enterococcus casseliflavus]